MKVSLIVTVKNEEKGIEALLTSIVNQTVLPDEVIITDAGSIDYTRKIIASYKKKLSLQLIELPATANRAVGRNRAIETAAYDHILITDAGCVLDSGWVEKMKEGFEYARVVAGFYQSSAHSIFETCVAAYALVMPDRLNTSTFLPATRSMGITKSVWKTMGRFNETYRYAEDYAFARRLRDQNVPIHVASDAIVCWRPRSDLFGFARMIYEHAYGDGYSRTWRPKVWFIFIRYFLFTSLLFLSLFSLVALFFSMHVLTIYCVYAIAKNYRYVRHWKALVYLPLLQLIADCMVMVGTISGVLARKDK